MVLAKVRRTIKPDLLVVVDFPDFGKCLKMFPERAPQTPGIVGILVLDL